MVEIEQERSIGVKYTAVLECFMVLIAVAKVRFVRPARAPWSQPSLDVSDSS